MLKDMKDILAAVSLVLIATGAGLFVIEGVFYLIKAFK